MPTAHEAEQIRDYIAELTERVALRHKSRGEQIQQQLFQKVLCISNHPPWYVVYKSDLEDQAHRLNRLENMKLGKVVKGIDKQAQTTLQMMEREARFMQDRERVEMEREMTRRQKSAQEFARIEQRRSLHLQRAATAADAQGRTSRTQGGNARRASTRRSSQLGPWDGSADEASARGDAVVKALGPKQGSGGRRAPALAKVVGQRMQISRLLQQYERLRQQRMQERVERYLTAGPHAVTFISPAADFYW